MLMFVLDKFGIVEQRGLGFETVKGLPKKNLPLPIVSFEEPYIVVMLPLTYEAAISVTQDELSEPEIKYIDYIRMFGPITRKDFELYASVDRKKAERILSRLVEKGLILREGNTRATKYRIKI